MIGQLVQDNTRCLSHPDGSLSQPSTVFQNVPWSLSSRPAHSPDPPPDPYVLDRSNKNQLMEGLYQGRAPCKFVLPNASRGVKVSYSILRGGDPWLGSIVLNRNVTGSGRKRERIEDTGADGRTQSAKLTEGLYQRIWADARRVEPRTIRDRSSPVKPAQYFRHPKMINPICLSCGKPEPNWELCEDCG